MSSECFDDDPEEQIAQLQEMLEDVMASHKLQIKELNARIEELEAFVTLAASTFSSDSSFVKMANQMLAKEIPNPHLVSEITSK
jgi:hypothetical protein